MRDKMIELQKKKIAEKAELDLKYEREKAEHEAK